MFNGKSFFTVIIIKLDIFESTIVDERHFANRSEAHNYAQTMNKVGYISVIAEI